MIHARYLAEPLPLDGRLTHPAWQGAERTPEFVDMASGEPAILATQAAVLWDERALHVGFWVQEPFPTAHLTERGSLIFQENDVEVFIDGGDAYYEFEVNARNTVYEMLFIWRDAFERFDQADFDPRSRDAYRFGGDYDRRPASFWEGTHPRGTRWAYRDWTLQGVESEVHVDGELNNPNVRSSGWTVHVAFPWAGMGVLAGGRALPPDDGDVWRLFLGRFQQLQVAGKSVTAAWCATPHGDYDTHMPERFTEVRFVR